MAVVARGGVVRGTRWLAAWWHLGLGATSLSSERGAVPLSSE
jgi:hypothetical protein